MTNTTVLSVIMDVRDAVPAAAEDDPEDILSESLQSLYDLSPVTFSTAGAVFTYSIDPRRLPPLRPPGQTIQVATPDTQPSNWSLHASSIWASALFIADHLEELLPDTLQVATNTGPDVAPRIVHALELGAGAGLPSILLASMYPNVSVTASDYPDDRLMRTLSDNIRRNAVSERCRAVPHAWGTDTKALLASPGHARFDIVFAADTLWNPELHAPLLDTLCGCLKRSLDARIHLVAGLHTGRYTIQSFLDCTRPRGLILQSATEQQVNGTQTRPWSLSHVAGEDERERRRWVVWMVLKWENTESCRNHRE